MNIRDLVDIEELRQALAAGLVRRQHHPELPYVIWNYTSRCAYEKAWNPVTTTCRGLIISEDDGTVIARPFGKFFNYGEHPPGSLDLDAPAEVTSKEDGSLGICFPHPGEWRWSVATRGSFTSTQALWATSWFREHADLAFFSPRCTYLFEIIARWNRIVVDYDWEGLVLLAILDTETGADLPLPEDPGVLGDGFRVVTRFSAATLAQALALPPRDNAEGVVVRMLDSGVRVKLKQARYLQLHRILTGTNARTVWEYLAVNACRDLITAPKMWGSLLHLDPARAEQILTVPDWLEALTAGVPDEFHAWLHATIIDLAMQFETLRDELVTAFGHTARNTERREFAQAVKDHPHAGALFLLLDGRDITCYLWTAVYPPPDKAWGERSEDVA